ncbi:hypothetical protein [Bittarella massiliensis (ex Durand et al. 2017)]|uniref:Prepilin-type N-terminal cleavage/methylation domain-containing protein n=1 Tax=Bittarella massiliensis (ex Durand et al. 2017) TaxID=1720313 RepID=A0AAW5KAA7_9FIRM|nr:hypothetical protein [Bittarella massiliensis (ex Durand et al. 2017)]MCQ4949563.1 hypothetical protein [Bittarella massiliensis (ex Durand et al. 2017)]
MRRRSRGPAARRGWTLVEVSVVLLLLVLVVALAGGMILSGGNLLGRSAQLGEEKLIGDTACQWLSGKLRYATELRLVGGDDLSAPEAVWLEEGRLWYRNSGEGAPQPGQGIDYYGDAFYQGRTLSVTAALHDQYYLDLTVRVHRADGALCYTTRTTVKLLNLQISGAPAEGPTGEVEDPALLFASGQGAG